MDFEFLTNLFRRLPKRRRNDIEPQRSRILVNWTNPSDQEVADTIKAVPRHGADGIYYVDKRLPHLVADQSAVTPDTTMKSIWANGASSPTILPANYWTPGKTLRLTAGIKLTTGTAGNSQFAMAYGAAAAPSCVVTTTTRAKIASVGPFGGFMQGYATCRTTGTGGTLSMWGFVYMDLSVFLSTVQPMVFPSDGVTVVSTIDTTVGTNNLFFQYLTSAGTDSILATNIVLEAMN